MTNASNKKKCEGCNFHANLNIPHKVFFPLSLANIKSPRAKFMYEFVTHFVNVFIFLLIYRLGHSTVYLLDL